MTYAHSSTRPATSWFSKLTGWTQATPSRPKPARTSRRAQFRVDSLEGRQLMSAQIVQSADAHVVGIFGTPQADLASVVQSGQNLVVAVKSPDMTQPQVKTFPVSAVKQILFLGGAGDDTFLNLSSVPCVA
jgi:hypothetical protein